MSPPRKRDHFVALLAMTVVMASCATPSRAVAPASAANRPSSRSVGLRSAGPPTKAAGALPVPEPLVDPRLDLRSAPEAVPLQLEIPRLKVSRPVLGVGITKANVMDAPEGPAQDPVWQDAFWYRGGGIPGQAGTATIAGHVDDSVGRPATFAHLHDLHPGDAVIVRDLRKGLKLSFAVNAAATYSLDEASSPSVLAEIYGTGPVAGRAAQPSSDGLSHLTLITCTGTFDHHLGTHDHRLVVYATRVS